MSGPLLAVDAPFVLYRSFFALPDSIVGADERPVNALLGAANVLLRIAADRDPRAIVVCFGAEAAAYRAEAFPPTTPTARRSPTRWRGSSSTRPSFSKRSGGAVGTRRISRPTTCSARWRRSSRPRAAGRCC